MYCAACGQPITEAAFRCPACNHFSQTFWLVLITVVAWLAIVAMTYSIFICLLPAVARSCAQLDVFLPQMMRLNLSWANSLETYGIPILLAIVIHVSRMAKAFPRRPRLARGATLISGASLIMISVIVMADGHYLKWFGAKVLEPRSWEIAQQNDLWLADLSGKNATRSVIIAEYRYKDLHPNMGFTCDFKALKSLGGPSAETSTFALADARKGDTVSVDIFVLSLSSCQGMPVTKYKVSTVPDPSFGTMFQKAAAYCSDGSGILYSAEDGKSETCQSAHTLPQ
jgi:hypothetical protein